MSSDFLLLLLNTCMRIINHVILLYFPLQYSFISHSISHLSICVFDF